MGKMNEGGTQIGIVIVDDDPFVCDSLATILSAQEGIEVRATGSDGEEAISLYEREAPDILLMDIQMPGMSGLEAAEAIISSDDDARIVFLTTFSDDEYIVAALRMGAKGYLIKQEVSNIAPALRSVMAGQSVLAGEVVGKVDLLMGSAPAGSQEAKGQGDGSGSEEGYTALDHAMKAEARSKMLAAGLTEREAEIIELIALGYDNREIAHTVFISEGTVRNHVSAILQKLDLKNRTQLAVHYYRNLRP